LRKTKGEWEVFSGEGLLSERDIFRRKDGGRDIFRKGKEESFQAEGKGGERKKRDIYVAFRVKIMKAKTFITKQLYVKELNGERKNTEEDIEMVKSQKSIGATCPNLMFFDPQNPRFTTFTYLQQSTSTTRACASYQCKYF
jgi:hypothetical protein